MNTSVEILTEQRKNKTMKIEEIAELLGACPLFVSRLDAEGRGEMPNILTLEEANEIYADAPFGSKLERFALRKWKEFSFEEAKSADTLDQLRRAFRRIHDEDWDTLGLIVSKMKKIPYPEEKE